MAKVSIEKDFDNENRLFYRLSKKRGAISLREAYEAMEKERYYGKFLMDFPVTEIPPEDYYEEGDVWIIYPVDEMLQEKASEEFNEGYKACMRDYKIDA